MRSLQTHFASGTAADLDAIAADRPAEPRRRHRGRCPGRHAAVGATQNRIDAADSRLADAQATVKNLLSGVEDTDYATALTDLAAQQAGYQAALQATASVIQPSLLDYLTQ